MLESFNSANVFNTLRLRAAQAGTNLTAVCEKAGVPRNTVEAWKKNPPKSFAILEKLVAELDKMEPQTPAAE